jgi:hypothetical protein
MGVIAQFTLELLCRYTPVCIHHYCDKLTGFPIYLHHCDELTGFYYIQEPTTPHSVLLFFTEYSLQTSGDIHAVMASLYHWYT